MHSGCQCGFDPYVNCPKHRCQCTHCKKGTLDLCRWRAQHKDYIMLHDTSKEMQNPDLLQLTSALMTYCRVVFVWRSYVASSWSPNMSRQRSRRKVPCAWIGSCHLGAMRESVCNQKQGMAEKFPDDVAATLSEFLTHLAKRSIVDPHIERGTHTAHSSPSMTKMK